MMNIHFLRVSVGEEFESGLLGCFWLGISHEVSVKISPNVHSHGRQVGGAVGWRLLQHGHFIKANQGESVRKSSSKMEVNISTISVMQAWR